MTVVATISDTFVGSEVSFNSYIACYMCIIKLLDVTSNEIFETIENLKKLDNNVGDAF